MVSIRRLPPTLIDQIAAGEVVERPASVVKELVENSIDAGATRIEVQIAGGGQKRIVVNDDARGIRARDLKLALTSHATSKINDFDDLQTVASFGFRGEALASIGAISHLHLTSRVAGEKLGAAIVCRGGVLEDVRPEGRPPGTSVDVRDLFYNTPARRKFLKSDATEVGHILETMLRFSLSCPELEIQLETGARRSLHVTAKDDGRERIALGYGRELADSLLNVSAGFGDFKLRGWIAPPSQAKARSPVQHLYLNGRFVRDRTIQGAVRRAYHDFLAESLRPSYFLFLEMDPCQVDINVHPTKIEVRLRNSSAVYRAVVGAIERSLQKADLTPRFRSPPAPARAPLWSAASHRPVVSEPRPTVSFGPAAKTEPATPNDELAEVLSKSLPATEPDSLLRASLKIQPGRYLQILNTYLATATAEGLLLLDQHALHERVLYRQFRQQWNDQSSVPRQDLLTPLRVELSAQDVMLLLDSETVLDSVGIRIAPFGETELAVSAVPAALGTRNLDSLFARLVEFLRGDRPNGRLDDFADRMLFTMACHKAVRAGDPLNDAQIQGLLEEAEKIEHAHTCPHGRPTRVLIPLAELENLFKRRGF